MHVCASVCVWRQERKEEHSAGENRQLVSDGEIGTGTRSDREKESRGQGEVEAKRDRASEGRGTGHGRGEAQKSSDRQPGTGGRLSNRVRVSDGESDKTGSEVEEKEKGARYRQ